MSSTPERAGAAPREFGIVGLGQIGGNIARQALAAGFRVAGQTKGGAPPDLIEAGLLALQEPAGFRAALRPPRLVFLWVPAGPVVDTVLEELAAALEPGDVIADGGNSYWGDSIRRHGRLREQGLGFVDLGTSGGLPGARQGACFMAGGEAGAVARLEPICRALAVEGGFVHAGGPGMGHFVKLVHNGIEFGMLQAIAKGYALLRRQDAPLDVQATLECWRRGSVIRSWLVDLLAEAHHGDPGLGRAESGYVEDTGEVNWLVMDAIRMEVPVPVIAQSVMQLIASREAPAERDWARAVIAMRHGFGGHPFGPEESIARERREGRVGPIHRPAPDQGN
ncbi:NADP-dependent phosphogluconate dehydrogenase [Roseicella aerolata]|uniref:NADP-dependent phosphogluconate dehydrogenase n=1 Tax=Roseicella aerolata TaxID=2883479 RepID=A0A9X1IF08_9PROT|nr:NADP-dependent phosphogluconate dehydrogenase [Roseicella aerolata]MCB4823530.1 NADP-dependent phosphogluconate dehydrogenase [Roseicella aerolata]